MLTFDNLGEASELERGTWPSGEPLGHHPSVTRALPRLLDELDRHGLGATFFVEGINCELYPGALREIVARGHALGAHGWRHEVWSELPAARERALLARATDAFAELEVSVRAFRPPGGAGTGQTPSLLAELGYTWWSPSARDGEGGLEPEGGRPVEPEGGRPVELEGGRPVESEGGRLETAAFDWDLVDAYHLMERFADLRTRRHDPVAALTPARLGDHLAARLTSPRAAARPPVLVLHPFLMLDEAWWEQVRRLLSLLAGA